MAADESFTPSRVSRLFSHAVRVDCEAVAPLKTRGLVAVTTSPCSIFRESLEEIFCKGANQLQARSRCPSVSMSSDTRAIEKQREDEAAAELESYCKEFPKSPSALRRPRVMLRGSSWIALLGSTLQDGIAGIGSTVRSALRAFDAQYTSTSPRRR